MGNTYKVGDVVVLKSGGPEMTVYEIQNSDYVNCTWFVGDKPQYASFPSGVLEKVEEE